MTWWAFALLSAVAAAVTAILAKLGVSGVPSNVATAIRTVVVLAFSWGIVFANREHTSLRELKTKSLIFLILSGVATGVSWLAYFKAMSMAPASKVAPLDKISVALTIALSSLILGETITWKAALGGTLIVIGALLTIPPS
jgi:bacterial/archaeal transporter family protein